jgi:hypothetical protein
LYVRLNKALYGTLQAASLFWKQLPATFQEWEFIISPYDQCIANKEINGRQFAVIWHVNDLKISNCKGKVVSEIINKLSEVLGKESPLTMHQGAVHDYFGMKIDFQ